MAFKKKDYDIKYMKTNKKQFKVDLNLGEHLKNVAILDIKNINNVDFVRDSFRKIEENLTMKEKIELINKMIEKIIENAINEYTSNFDENNGMSVSDWKNGYKNTIRNFDGNIIEYIPYSSFNDLYYNFKYDFGNWDLIDNKIVYKFKEETLNKIIAYLEKEAKYTKFYDLDQDGYCIEDFINLNE